MKKSTTLQVLIVVVCLMTVAGAKQSAPMKVLVSMLPAQEEFFVNDIIKPFAKKEKVKIDVVHFKSVDSIPAELAGNARQAVVVKVPFDKAGALIEKGLVKPLDDFLRPEDFRSFSETYLLTSLGKQHSKQYYIPRKFETRVMVYLKSRVAQAVATWHQYRDDMNTELKKYNGFGLPAMYTLENDPNRWDFYDIFVVGWVWSHTPYDGKMTGRIGHRGMKYSGTALRIIDRVFSCGGDSLTVISMQSKEVVDAYYWESLYAASGVYNPRMWLESWNGSGIWQGFKDGGVFLAFMTQLDCFYIHGTGRDGLDGFLPHADDMGVAIMPSGCSVALDAVGNVVREGTHAVSTGGWWWGIPHDTPDPYLSYKIISAITSTENQVQECNRFGMIPVRKDILSDMSMLFGGGWITEIYDVSFKQLMANKKATLPSHPRFDQIRNVYLDAWFDIVVNHNWSADKKQPDARYIEQVINDKYAGIVAGLR